MKTKASKVRKKIQRYTLNGSNSVLDQLSVEEPLEIRIAHGTFPQRLQTAVSVTMRTPGYDHELAAGFLFTEGILRNPSDIADIKHIPTPGRFSEGNVILVELSDGILIDLRKLERHFYTTSSCGVCGKTAIEAVYQVCPPRKSGFSVDPDLLKRLPEALRQAQKDFNATGGLHAAAIFNQHGELRLLREDIGRHNAVDKIIGHQLLGNLFPLNDVILLVSGRAGFELVQKAAVAGITCFAAVGAPSTLSVELAKASGMTLIGFLKEKSFNLYSGSL